MSETCDLIIRNGMIVDGTGAPPFAGDVAVKGGRIVAVGAFAGIAGLEIDAAGCIVTPGFVDIHTHYDGQAIWSGRFSPSSSHGVTTVVTGNCGVGFAPCRAQDRDLLIATMEGVEDIPEIVMTSGLTWEWESFPEFLDAVDRRDHDIDVAAFIPHSAVRVFAMGRRGSDRETATPEDLDRMAGIVRDAVKAGALGFSTSDAAIHRRIDGDHVPSYHASERELTTLAHAIRDGGGSLFQISPDPFLEHSHAREAIDQLGRISADAGVRITFSLAQTDAYPVRWRETLEWIDESRAKGAALYPQVFPRPIGMIVGHAISTNPFALCPSYQALSKLPLEKRIQELRRPEVRRALTTEAPADPTLPLSGMSRNFARMFALSDTPDYEPALSESVASRAGRLGITPEELAYDLLLENDGNACLMVAISNYADGNLDFVLELVSHPNVIVGLGDGGAHYGLVSDSSYPTFVLSHMVRDRARPLGLAEAVRALSSKPAGTVGLHDRGTIAPGYKADLNVIDLGKLRLLAPEVEADLPSGGRRLHQRAEGYRCTIVGGRIIAQDDVPTGAVPGRLVRGIQPAPSPTGMVSQAGASGPFRQAV